MTDRPSHVTILDTRIDTLPIDTAIQHIISTCRQPGSRYVVKPYVEFFDSDFQDICNEAWLSLPDGVAVQWAAHYQATNGSLWNLFRTLAQIVLQPDEIRSIVPDKFAGINFTWPLLEAAAAHQRSVFLVGSPQHGTIEQTAETLRRSIPELRIAGTLTGKNEDGAFSPQLERTLRDELRARQPDIILLGLGHPTQEHVMRRLKQVIDSGVMIGEGGTFDYQLFGGKRSKAPRFMQRIGLEWLWRLVLEPRRIRRQLAIPRFIIRMYIDLHRT